MSGDAAEVVLEAGTGGRIYERTAAGTRHEWGEVTVWEPPRRLSYLWHIGRERATATEVAITFVDEGGTRTGSRSSTPGGRSWVTRRRPGGIRTAADGMRCCRTSWQP